MTEAVLWKIGYVIVVLVAYGLVRWRLMVVTSAFRIRVGRDADRLAADDRVPENFQKALKRSADRVYGPMTPWLIVLGMLIAGLMPYQRLHHKHEAMMRSISSSEVRKEVSHLIVRLIFAAVTTSPLATIVFVLILTSAVLLRASAESLGRSVEAIAGRALRRWDQPLGSFRI